MYFELEISSQSKTVKFLFSTRENITHTGNFSWWYHNNTFCEVYMFQPPFLSNE